MQGRAGAMSEPKYLTFPIVLLKDGLNNIKECMNDAMNYCLYDKYIRFEKSYSYNPMNDALNDVGINFGDTANIKKSWQNGKMLYDSIDEKFPKTSINKEMMFDFYKNKKSEFEIVCFLAFCALKSIIQRQVYKSTGNDYLFSRMSGNNKKGEDIDPLLKRYKGRYQRDKLINELRLSWGLKYVAGNRDMGVRGFYVSFTMPINSLALIAVRNNKKYKLEKLEKEKKEAMMRAVEQVKNEPLPANIKNNATSDEQNIDKT